MFGKGISLVTFTHINQHNWSCYSSTCCGAWWKIKQQRKPVSNKVSYDDCVPPCSCCAQHKYHRYWFYPWHLCCETRLLQRKRLAGNFPPCDSPLLSAEGACAQNQEGRKETRGRAKQEGDGKVIRKHRRERDPISTGIR